MEVPLGLIDSCDSVAHRNIFSTGVCTEAALAHHSAVCNCNVLQRMSIRTHSGSCSACRQLSAQLLAAMLHTRHSPGTCCQVKSVLSLQCAAILRQAARCQLPPAQYAGRPYCAMVMPASTMLCPVGCGMYGGAMNAAQLCAYGMGDPLSMGCNPLSMSAYGMGTYSMGVNPPSMGHAFPPLQRLPMVRVLQQACQLACTVPVYCWKRAGSNGLPG